jgi:hypothetical protein
VEFVNKTFEDVALETKIISPEGASLSKVGEQQITVPAGEILKSVYFIKIPTEQVTTAKTVVLIGVYKDGELVEKLKVKFIGPVHSHKDRTKGR